MPTTEELLAQLEAEAQSETPVCIIDPETRTITVPPEYQLLGVENDKRVERLYFQCPKIVGDNQDLSQDYQLFVNYQNANGDPDAYHIDDMEVDGDNITFSWLLEENVTKYRGDIQFAFGAIIPGDAPEDPDKNRWNTTINTDCTCLVGLKCTQQVAESNPDALAQIWAAIDELKAGGGGSGTPGKDGREIEIQNNGTAIQWRYVGDSDWTDLVQLSDLKGEGIPEGGTTGQVLTKNSDGDASWEDPSAVSDEQVKTAVRDYFEENPVSGMTEEQEQQLLKNTQDITDLKKSVLSKVDIIQGVENAGKFLGIDDGGNVSLMNLAISEIDGCKIYDILEYGAEKWDGKRISGTQIVNAGSNYYGYVLDRTKVKKESRLVISNNPSNIVIVAEKNLEVGSSITVLETLSGVSAGTGGYQYTITPGEGYIIFYKQGEFSWAFICDEMHLSKNLDIPGGTYISGVLEFETKGNFTGFKLPDIPSGTIAFLKVSDDVNLQSVQIQDISGESAERITVEVNTNSTVMCWISNGKLAMLRYGKSHNASYKTLYETMRVSIVYLNREGISIFKKANAIGNSTMCGIYANNKNDSLFLSLFADYLECDVQKSSDGIYVLNHNGVYSGLTISDTDLNTLQGQGIWTLDELYRFVSECNLGLALDAKVEITESDIRKAHAITRGKNVIVSGNQFSEPPFYFTIYHDKRTSSFPEEYAERVLYDSGNTIEEPELRNGLNSMATTGDLSKLSDIINGLDVIEYDVNSVKQTLTQLYGCTF